MNALWDAAIWLFQLLAEILLALMVWFIGRRLLAGLMPWGSVRSCPGCYNTLIRQSHRRNWERLSPLPVYRCRSCNKRFILSGRPPFACCPKCGTPELQKTSGSRVPPGFTATIRHLTGSHGYNCAKCRLHFLDSRLLRVETETHNESAGDRPNGMVGKERSLD